ncbi:hypothetical protein JL49_20380 [Pseudoalteromonas luteoviolacea]|uniref:Uncharacterized protein n=2 Tax=Pseudoalteromonas luteoviolacea TaxID=43657 RepID=A0A167HPT0_9GAMM|nr:hypothetical protein N482_22540 [Pseudoalteromonas luteoviolacea NCIMB 1942]KZW98915.1 hypothetical protein JL49_20380 [Pseudoalteromonas luteoviolacea]
MFALALIASGAANAVVHVKDAVIESVYCGYVDTYNMCSILFTADTTLHGQEGSCHTLPAKRMQFKGDTPMGSSLLSLALTAHTTKARVDVYARSNCSIYPGLSDVDFITIK